MTTKKHENTTLEDFSEQRLNAIFKKRGNPIIIKIEDISNHETKALLKELIETGKNAAIERAKRHEH